MTKAEALAEVRPYSDLIQIDGMDDAILGVVGSIESSVLAYSYLKCIQIHMEMGMEYQDAREWIDTQYPHDEIVMIYDHYL